MTETTSTATLINTKPGNRGVIVTAIENSGQGLWITNYGANRPLHIWNNDGSWESYPLISDFPIEMLDTSGQLWMRYNKTIGQGLMVFDKTSQESIVLDNSPNTGGLADDQVNAMAQDREGLIWIGTDLGVSVFTNPLGVFAGNVDAVEPIFESRALLRDESVTSIAVDGGNRKWIGTRNGVWLFDAEADVQLLNFNVENSPLPDNEILDIEIDLISGEVFFLTSSGIISYRGSSTRGSSQHSEVKIFPNPVPENFVGTVGISGLVNDSSIRITDSSGKLIWKTFAAGGTATWNVRDYNGNRAATGVYLVFSASSDGKETYVGKIAVIN